MYTSHTTTYRMGSFRWRIGFVEMRKNVPALCFFVVVLANVYVWLIGSGSVYTNKCDNVFIKIHLNFCNI